MAHEIGQNNVKKIETDCNGGFRKLVLLAYVHGIFLFITFDVTQMHALETSNQVS